VLQPVEPRAEPRQRACRRRLDLADERPRRRAERDRRLKRHLAELVMRPRHARPVARERKRVEALAERRQLGERRAAVDLGDQRAERRALPRLPGVWRRARRACRDFHTLVVGVVDCTASWALDGLGVHATQGMPPKRGATGVLLLRRLGNVPVFRHRLHAVAEAFGVVERIASRHLLDQGELGDQVDELLEHRPDAEPARLGLVVRDDTRARVERQEQLGEPRGLARRAPETAAEPRECQKRRRVGESLVRDEHRAAGKDALLEPEPLTRAERRATCSISACTGSPSGTTKIR